MDVLIRPAPMTGAVAAIASKSDAHRLLICAALAEKPTTVRLPTTSQDIDATCRCLEALGAGVVRREDEVTITPIREVPENPLLDCGESGSTLRFLLPVAAALTHRARFTGRGRLPQRPIRELTAVLEAHGVRFSAPALPFAVEGGLRPGAYAVPGNVSSQYVTGLLLALTALGGGSTLDMTTPQESRGYVDMTLHALARFGAAAEQTPTGWRLPAGQRLRAPGTLAVEGDWSNAAFFLGLGALTGPVTVTGLNLDAAQGDRVILGQLERFGAVVGRQSGGVTVFPAGLTGCEINVAQTPDVLPILAVLAARAKGETRLTGAARLRDKESDRLSAMAAVLHSLGGTVTQLPDGLVIRGGTLTGGLVDGCGDHRIVMAASIAAAVCENPVTITGAQAVDKSYPRFFDDYNALGGNAYVL